MADDSDDDRTHSFVALTAGTEVSHYKIISKIGAGGMGEVYLAQDTELDRNVALKFLPPHLCRDEDCRKRFKREAQAAAGLDHPNIAGIHEVGEYNRRPFYSMQVIEGQSLRDVIAGKDMPIERILEIAIQVCEGLQAAHDKGIIHRDIKPSNILIDGHGRVRIVDFGLASIRGSEHLTRTGSTLGTIGYMSPEQVHGKEIDHRSDLFSLGVVLYELITKQNPFKRENEAATLKAVCDDLPEPLARFKRDVPQLLESTIVKLLEKNPSHRYQSGAGVVSDLQRLKRESDTAISARAAARAPMSSLRVILPTFLVILAVAVLVLKPWKFDISPSEEAVAAQNRLAIMNFDNLADSEDSLKLGEIAANLLITDLTESDYVQVVSGQRLHDILRQLGHKENSRIDKDIATQVARKARAKWMLLGSILATEPHYVITAQLVEVESGASVASQRIAGESDEDIFPVVDRLTVEIKQDLELPAGAQQEPDRPVADITTNSPQAYHHYLLGLENYYKFYWTEAEANFREALEYDSTFAMTYCWLLNFAPDDEHEWLRSKMLQYAHQASRKEQLYISIIEAFFQDDLAATFRGLTDMVKRYPDDKYILWMLSAIEWNFYRQRAQAILHLEEVVALDSNFGQAYNYLAINYAELGDFRQAFWAAEKYIEVAPDEANSYDTRGCLHAMNGQLEEAMTSFRQALDVKPDFSLTQANMGMMHLFKQDYTEAEEWFQKLASHSNRDERATGRLYLARIPLYRGQLQEAIKKLRVAKQARLMESGSLGTLLNTVLVSATIQIFFRSDHAAGLADIREAYDLMDSSAAPWPIQEMRFKGLEALAYAKAGRFGSADSLLQELASMYDSSWTYMAEIHNLWQGLVDFERSDYESSIRFLEQARMTSKNFPEEFFLARSYLAANRVSDAVEMFDTAIKNHLDRRLAWLGLSALVHYYAGLAYEESHWNDKAADQYEIFLDIWKRADPGIKEVEDARERLARLQVGS